MPVAFFASAGDFDGTVLLNPRVHGRIEIGLTDVVGLLRAAAASSASQRSPEAAGRPAVATATAGSSRRAGRG